jgi:hypothetical protein
MHRVSVKLGLVLALLCLAWVVGCGYVPFGPRPPKPATMPVGVVVAASDSGELLEGARVWIRLATPENLEEVIEDCGAGACGTLLGTTSGSGYVENDVSGMRRIDWAPGFIDVFTPEFWVFRVSTDTGSEVLAIGEELESCPADRGSFCRVYTGFDGRSGEGEEYRLTVDLP